jgi:hypothetical protein
MRRKAIYICAYVMAIKATFCRFSVESTQKGVKHTQQENLGFEDAQYKGKYCQEWPKR